MNSQRISLAILVLLIFGPISVCSRTAGLAITEPAPAKISKEKSQPNIVLFLVDDLGWQDSSVSFWTRNTEFQAHYHTPNVAKLAEQGVRFTNAYSHCVCSPTRTSIMTGQNPARHHVTNWTLYADRDQSGKTNRVAAPAGWRKSGIQTHDITLARKLKADDSLRKSALGCL